MFGATAALFLCSFLAGSLDPKVMDPSLTHMFILLFFRAYIITQLWFRMGITNLGRIVGLLNQAIKRQKLEGGKSRQDSAPSITQTKPEPRLTRPKGPDFETSQRVRVRPVRIKSSAQIEEEMMAKIPKFKTRPVNKKILEAPTLAAPQRSTPCLPEFHEFHLKTMERANQNAETSSMVSTQSAPQNQQWKTHLTASKSPALQTTLRARSAKIKSSKEELEKAPKFKARPLNKKLSISFDSHCDKQIPRNTTQNPFHLRTQERGAEKEKRFVLEVVQKQIEEEKARVPKAIPYPYTTDYPVIPPKPEPKYCTKPEPFQLESVARHEEQMRREMEKRQRKEKEEAEMRKFKAQPVLKEHPIPVLEKVRKPLTEVQRFNLHVDHRAVDRSEFDKKIKEKEMMYKRYRDEVESAKMMEEEKALKQLRRTLVPHARPVPNFSNPFLPQKSGKDVTKPKPPKLLVDKRKERRKFVGAVEADTSVASQMR